MTRNVQATGPWSGRQRETHIPARRVVAPTGGIVRGHFPSRTARRMVAFEQLVELDFLFLCEFAPQIVNIREQPFKLKYAMQGKVRIYTPDYSLIIRDGSILVVEVKPVRSLAKPEIREKLLHVREAMIRQGHQFIVMSSETIRLQPYLDNIKRLHRFLRYPLGPEQRRNLLRARSRHVANPVISMQCLTRELGGRDEVLWYLAHGEISCDLTQPLTEDTLMSLIPQEVDYVFVDSL